MSCNCEIDLEVLTYRELGKPDKPSRLARAHVILLLVSLPWDELRSEGNDEGVNQDRDLTEGQNNFVPHPNRLRPLWYWPAEIIHKINGVDP